MSNIIKAAPLPSIKELLHLYRLKALKQMSQNFLLDMNITDKIVRHAGDITDSQVCEVGPGPGGLTRSIMKKDPRRILVIEKDRRFKPLLEGLAKCSINPFDIVISDIIDFDFSQAFDASYKREWNDEPPRIHILGNLPFSVSTFLIFEWLKDISLKRNAWAFGRVKMTLTFQEEVAHRMIGLESTKRRSRVSVMCQNWCKIDYNFTISGQAFVPKPKVNVGVLTLEPLAEPIIPLDFNLVEKVLKIGFNSRQKYCNKTISNLFPNEVRKPLTDALFELADVHPQKRPFQLSNEEWGRICNAYKKICDRDPKMYYYNYRGNRDTREFDWKMEKDSEEEEEVDDEFEEQQ